MNYLEYSKIILANEAKRIRRQITFEVRTNSILKILPFRRPRKPKSSPSQAVSGSK